MTIRLSEGKIFWSLCFHQSNAWSHDTFSSKHTEKSVIKTRKKYCWLIADLENTQDFSENLARFWHSDSWIHSITGVSTILLVAELPLEEIIYLTALLNLGGQFYESSFLQYSFTLKNKCNTFRTHQECSEKRTHSVHIFNWTSVYQNS